jgi:hypothetical protein
MKMLAFGGGTDSTAILCGWVERGLEPFDLILFADTGGERPHTYEHIERMQDWLRRRGMPQITIVRKVRRDGRLHTLEENCLEAQMLPSLAYGFKSCSQKFKIAPQDKYVNNLPAAKAIWKAGDKVDKYIGYEFAETRRWMKAPIEDGKYRYHYPLVEWEWSRPDCLAAIDRAGLPRPGKSSCFFCPASTKPEIAALKQTYPVLFQRALDMEANAKLTSVKGLGRRFSWREYDTTLEEPDVVPCISCADGSNSCETPK